MTKIDNDKLPTHCHDAPAASTSAPAPQHRRAAPYTLAALLLISASCLSLVVPSPVPSSSSLTRFFGQGRHHHHHRPTNGAQCPAQIAPRNIGPDFDPTLDQEYATRAIERLQGAVKIPTESYDDMGSPDDDERFKIMGQLHEYLEKTFPEVYAAFEVEQIATYGLLMTWKGTDETLKPVVFMAHQDVVPVNPATLNQWTHKPYDAHEDDDGWIWGRGVADCKNTLIGILSAMTQLLSESYNPERTICLSFGVDEEIGGRRSAHPLASTLLSRYGRNGVSLIIDEGFTGITQAYGTTFALLGLAEKGAVSIQLEVLTNGGHSSVPPRHTGIGLLSRLVVALEDNPFGVELQTGNPVLSFLNCAADYGSMNKDLRKKVKDPREWHDLGEELARRDPVQRAFLGTTQAADLVRGGVKINALPEYATASVNYRVDFLSSVNATLAHIENVIRREMKKNREAFEGIELEVDLKVASAGDVQENEKKSDEKKQHQDGNKNNVVRLTTVARSQIEPAPLTPTTGTPAWELMSGTIRHVWRPSTLQLNGGGGAEEFTEKGEDGKEGIVVAPSGMIANTDTKWTWDLTRNIYRFTPARLDLIRNFHTVDERIHRDAHLSVIRFYYKLVRNTEGWRD